MRAVPCHKAGSAHRVLHRLMISGSDRHTSDWLSRVRVPGAEGLGRLLDRLRGVALTGASTVRAILAKLEPP
jgi:hypothetical protein